MTRRSLFKTAAAAFAGAVLARTPFVQAATAEPDVLHLVRCPHERSVRLFLRKGGIDRPVWMVFDRSERLKGVPVNYGQWQSLAPNNAVDEYMAKYKHLLPEHFDAATEELEDMLGA